MHLVDGDCESVPGSRPATAESPCEAQQSLHHLEIVVDVALVDAVVLCATREMRLSYSRAEVRFNFSEVTFKVPTFDVVI